MRGSMPWRKAECAPAFSALRLLKMFVRMNYGRAYAAFARRGLAGRSHLLRNSRILHPRNPPQKRGVLRGAGPTGTTPDQPSRMQLMRVPECSRNVQMSVLSNLDGVTGRQRNVVAGVAVPQSGGV